MDAEVPPRSGDPMPALPPTPGRRRLVLAVASALHFLHDGFSDLLYVLLPLWASDFGLSFAQVGSVRSVYTAGMSLFQIPAGLLAEQWGERRLLAVGTAVTATGFLAAGWTGGFVGLLGVLLAAGLGSGVQHPLSSSLVSRAYETGARRAALGTYNFSGDLGKVAVPATVGVAASAFGWRPASAAYGLLGLTVALLVPLALRRLAAGAPTARRSPGPARAAGWGIRDANGFRALTAIGMIDAATRTALLTFLPFALVAKGMTPAGVGGALGLVFAGGAVGKFVCGLAAERVGVIRAVVWTELVTAAGILSVVVAPLPLVLVVLLPLGVALNGTSSVLYGTVADLVAGERRSRAYGLYYTLTIGASSAAPVPYGLVSDVAGVPVTLALAGLLVLVTVPLCFALRRSLEPKGWPQATSG